MPANPREPSTPAVAGDGNEPIFILGVTPRSGTNFLWDLLLLHPDCAMARDPVREDLFLEPAELLLRYTAAVRASWDPRWGNFEPDVLDRLCAALGDGLISFLWTDRSRRLLTKSPSVANLDHFFTFFPRARLLLLVRDGRAVVESCTRTFGWDFDTAARRWAAAARSVRRFVEDGGQAGAPCRLVRYEDLVTAPERELRPILEFVALDPARYPFHRVTDAPVRGSSVFHGDGRTNVHWEPVAPDPSFRPLERWQDWNQQRQRRFAWLAGDLLEYFGYAAAERPSGALALAGHAWLDARWHAARWTRRSAFAARVRVGTATRPLRTRIRLPGSSESGT